MSRELETIQTRLNRLFSDAPDRSVDQGLLSEWGPAVDVAETDKEYGIKADLPDLKKDDVKVELLGGVLTVEGERKREKEEKGKTFHRIERSYGVCPPVRAADGAQTSESKLRIVEGLWSRRRDSNT